ncbi:MAG: hypothetical protein HY521_09445 [Proteobacteria bacterium]|nr:hypothetical protein [Pseudomonadota bacterium]
MREKTRTYRRWRATDYDNAPAALTPRQANFYRNLIGLSLALGSHDIPVDFETADARCMWLDHGCIKIAEHVGFIAPLENNDESGTVGHITLSWRVDGVSVRRG